MSLLQLANQPDKRRIRRPVIVPFFFIFNNIAYTYISLTIRLICIHVIIEFSLIYNLYRERSTIFSKIPSAPPLKKKIGKHIFEWTLYFFRIMRFLSKQKGIRIIVENLILSQRPVSKVGCPWKQLCVNVKFK